MTRYLPVSVRKRWPTLVRRPYLLAFLYSALISFQPGSETTKWRIRSGLPPIKGESGNGWVGTETVLVRLNNGYVPNPTFPIWNADLIIDPSGIAGRIGYDAVISAEMDEPCIVQIYSSSLGVPTTMTKDLKPWKEFHFSSRAGKICLSPPPTLLTRSFQLFKPVNPVHGCTP